MINISNTMEDTERKRTKEEEAAEGEEEPKVSRVKTFLINSKKGKQAGAELR